MGLSRQKVFISWLVSILGVQYPCVVLSLSQGTKPCSGLTQLSQQEQLAWNRIMEVKKQGQYLQRLFQNYGLGQIRSLFSFQLVILSRCLNGLHQRVRCATVWEPTKDWGLVQAKQEDDHLGKESTLHCTLAVLGIFDSFLIYDIFNLIIKALSEYCRNSKSRNSVQRAFTTQHKS